METGLFYAEIGYTYITMETVDIIEDHFEADMMTIYILKLEQNKYYVGRTVRPTEERLKEHMSGHGSTWTKLYKPLELVREFKTNSPFDESKTVYELMDKYGMDNVRGGSYVMEVLSEDDRIHINRELCGAKDKCFKCEGVGHFASQCKRGMSKAMYECFSCHEFGHFSTACPNNPNARRWRGRKKRYMRYQG